MYDIQLAELPTTTATTTMKNMYSYGHLSAIPTPPYPITHFPAPSARRPAPAPSFPFTLGIALPFNHMLGARNVGLF